MTTIGTAVLQIIPSLKGVSDAIEKQIDGKVVEVKVAPKVDKAAAAKAGKDAGETIVKETKAAVSKGEIGKAVTDDIKVSVKKAGAGKEIAKVVTDEVKTEVKKSSPGRELAKVIVDGLADGVKQGLPANSVGGVIVDRMAEGIKQGIETKGLGTQIVGSITSVIKAGNLGGQIKDAVLPGITQVGTQLRSGAAEWAKGIAESLRSGDIQGATGEIADTVTKTTDIISQIGESFGLQTDAVRDFGQKSSGYIGDIGTSVGNVVTDIGSIQGTTDTALKAADTLFGKSAAGPGMAKYIAALGEVGIALQIASALEQPAHDADQWLSDHFPGGKWLEDHNPGELGKKLREAADRTFPDFGTPGTPGAPAVVAAPAAPGQAPLVVAPPTAAAPATSDPTLFPFLLPKKNAVGGQVFGPGTSTSDSIPAWLSTKEFVVNADATQKHLPLLEAINSGKIPGFAGGGLVAGDQQLRQIIMQRFGISDIGGYRPADKYGEHSTGRALDVMVGNNKAKGDAVKDFALQNASAIDLKWAIWRQHLYYPGGGGYDMEDRGSPTQNHMDHVHIFSGTGITNGLRGALAGGTPAKANTAAPTAAAVAGPGAEDTTASDQTGAAAGPPSGSGVSLASSLSGLSSTGLSGLGKGVGTTGSGSDLSLFGNAAASAVSGQVSSALGVFGIDDNPPILQAASQLLSGISIGGHGGSSAAPLSASSTASGVPSPDSVQHGTHAGQAPGPVFNTTIQARDAEGALEQWKRWQDQRVAAKTAQL